MKTTDVKPPAKTQGGPPLTALGQHEAFVVRRGRGAWELVVINVPGDVLDDPAFVVEKREPTTLECCVQWALDRLMRMAQK